MVRLSPALEESFLLPGAVLCVRYGYRFPHVKIVGQVF
jgi:hypothetical protein